MTEKTPSQNWYHEAMTVFAKVGGWIAGPIILALFIGDWLDGKYHTQNRFLLICIAVAFVLSNIGLIVEVLKYNRKLKKIEQSINHERDQQARGHE